MRSISSLPLLSISSLPLLFFPHLVFFLHMQVEIRANWKVLCKIIFKQQHFRGFMCKINWNFALIHEKEEKIEEWEKTERRTEWRSSSICGKEFMQGSLLMNRRREEKTSWSFNLPRRFHPLSSPHSSFWGEESVRLIFFCYRREERKRIFWCFENSRH